MKTKSAFSVLEVLIALSILSITLMAVYQSFASSLFVLQSTKTPVSYTHLTLPTKA